MTHALNWEYDPRIGKRWNLDPRPTIGISEYSVFRNNPIAFSDPLGDTTGYYSNNQELLFTTYAPGYNRITIVDDSKLDAIREWAKSARGSILKLKGDDKIQAAIDKSYMMQNIGITYDLHNYEKFYREYENKMDVFKIGGGYLNTAYDITLNNKPIGREQLIAHIKSLKVGPEWLASLVVKNGLVVYANDARTDQDLTKVGHEERPAHIHQHPPLVLDLQFHSKDPTTGAHLYSSTVLPNRIGPVDAHDLLAARAFGLRSIVVNVGYIYLYNGFRGQTIRFNRQTRNYESK